MNQHVQNYIEYDDYIVGRLGTIEFATRDSNQLYWPQTSVGFEVTGELGGAGYELYDHFKVVMKRPGPVIAEIVYYVFKREDAPALAHALSLEYPGTAVDVYARSRVMVRFMDGAVVGEIETLDTYYNDTTTEELEATQVVWPPEESGR